MASHWPVSSKAMSQPKVETSLSGGVPMSVETSPPIQPGPIQRYVATRACVERRSLSAMIEASLLSASDCRCVQQLIACAATCSQASPTRFTVTSRAEKGNRCEKQVNTSVFPSPLSREFRQTSNSANGVSVVANCQVSAGRTNMNVRCERKECTLSVRPSWLMSTDVAEKSGTDGRGDCNVVMSLQTFWTLRKM